MRPVELTSSQSTSWRYRPTCRQPCRNLPCCFGSVSSRGGTSKGNWRMPLLQKQVTDCPTSPPPVISVRVVSPGQSRVVGRLRGQAPSFVSQPVHFRGGASLHCAQHHSSEYTTPFHGNGRHRATTASASAITTATHRSHIHRMAVFPRVSPAKRTTSVLRGSFQPNDTRRRRSFRLLLTSNWRRHREFPQSCTG